MLGTESQDEGAGRQKRRQHTIELSEETPSIRNDWNKDFKEVRQVGDWPCEDQDKNVQHRVSSQPKVSKDEVSLACLKNTKQATWVELSEVRGRGRLTEDEVREEKRVRSDRALGPAGGLWLLLRVK